MPHIDHIIEGILFIHPEGVARKELLATADASHEEVEEALVRIGARLSHGPTILLRTDDTIALALKKEVYAHIQEKEEGELNGELGQGTLEVLAIVLYHGPISQTRIDYLRGVRSHGMTKALLMRGLIEKRTVEDRTLFAPALALLSHMGISQQGELPDFETFSSEAAKLFSTASL